MPKKYAYTYKSVHQFIEDPSIRLPRFQRKQTWDDKKNFQLCISLFKEYPLGVSILNHGKNDVLELLDGRQRRNALIKMYQNPENIYWWAKKFVGFKDKTNAYDLCDLFDSKVDAYLETDEGDKDPKDDEISVDEIEEIEECDDFSEDESDEDASEESVDAGLLDGVSGTELLKKIVEASHGGNKYGTGFVRPFNFMDYVTNLPYVIEPYSGNYKLDGRFVRQFIVEYTTNCNQRHFDYKSEDTFLDYIKSRCMVKEGCEEKLKKTISKNWEAILFRIDMISRINRVFEDSQIGIIEVFDRPSSDTQKIFNIINSEGVKLTAAEILSAKPSWSKKINNPGQALADHTAEMYKCMGLSANGVVRWDVPATLLERLGRNIVFSQLSWGEKAEFEKKLTLGFKTLSGLSELKGIKKEDIEKLGATPSQNWESVIEEMVNDLIFLMDAIKDYPYFSFLNSWKATIMWLTSDAVALDFILMTYFDWKRKGKPKTQSNPKMKMVQKNAFILWDKLIYEYVCNKWRGSSDSKIARNIADISSQPEVYVPISTGDWMDLLEEIRTELTVAGSNVAINTMKPLLYHAYCLLGMQGPDSKFSIEVDHVIPQSLFRKSTLAKAKLKQDCLFNLGLLPKKENISKSDDRLDSVDNPWLISEIEKYEFIARDDFEKYSKLSNCDELFDERKKKFEEAYGERRTEDYLDK